MNIMMGGRMIRCALGFLAWSMLEPMTGKCIVGSLAEAWQEHRSTSLAISVVA
jgi:hypothetical protein